MVRAKKAEAESEEPVNLFDALKIIGYEIDRHVPDEPSDRVRHELTAVKKRIDGVFDAIDTDRRLERPE